MRLAVQEEVFSESDDGTGVLCDYTLLYCTS